MVEGEFKPVNNQMWYESIFWNEYQQVEPNLFSH